MHFLNIIQFIEAVKILLINQSTGSIEVLNQISNYYNFCLEKL